MGGAERRLAGCGRLKGESIRLRGVIMEFSQLLPPAIASRRVSQSKVHAARTSLHIYIAWPIAYTRWTPNAEEKSFRGQQMQKHGFLSMDPRPVMAALAEFERAGGQIRSEEQRAAMGTLISAMRTEGVGKQNDIPLEILRLVLFGNNPLV